MRGHIGGHYWFQFWMPFPALMDFNVENELTAKSAQKYGHPNWPSGKKLAVGCNEPQSSTHDAPAHFVQKPSSIYMLEHHGLLGLVYSRKLK